MDWAGLLRRTFALDGLRLSAVWRQAKGAGVCDGPRWVTLDKGAPGTSHAGAQAGPGPGDHPSGRGAEPGAAAVNTPQLPASLLE